jgi:hypothetical protein
MKHTYTDARIAQEIALLVEAALSGRPEKIEAAAQTFANVFAWSSTSEGIASAGKKLVVGLKNGQILEAGFTCLIPAA